MAHSILEVNTQGASIGGPSSNDSETSLSTSSTLRLKSAFPNGPQHTDAEGPPGPVDGVTLGRESYREYYETEVLSGDNSSYAGKSLNGTVSSRNYKNNNPPDLTKRAQPDGEMPAGQTGSSIVKSGLGPNVNVNKSPNDKVVDPTPTQKLELTYEPLGSSDENPSETSADLSQSKLHIYPPGVSQVNLGE